ncbi:MAG: flippase [Patescibacteria group bacterium]
MAELAKNTYVQFAARGIGTALGVVAIALLTRTLGPVGFGAYTTVTSFLQIFGVLVDFGLTIVGLQLLSEPGADEGRVLGNVLGVRLVTAIIFLGIAPLAVLFFPYPQEVKVGVAFTTLSFLALAIHQIITTLFQKRLQMRAAAAAELAGRVALVILVGLAAWFSWGFYGMLVATTVANILQLAVALFAANRMVPIRIRYEPAYWKHILTLSWPIGVSIAFNLIYLRADAVILSLTRSQGELGLYGAAYRVIDVLTVLPFLLMGLVLPRLVAAVKTGDTARFGALMARAARFLLAAILPICFGGLVLADQVMIAVSGEAFAPSGMFLAVLLFGVAMIFWGTVYSHAVVALGLQRTMLPFYALNAALALVLYIWLIPRFGGPAAAWITVLSETTIAIAAAVVVRRKMPMPLPLGNATRIILAAALMAAALWLTLRTIPLPLLVSLPLGGLLYAAFLRLTGGLTTEDWRAILAPFVRNKPVVS